MQPLRDGALHIVSGTALDMTTARGTAVPAGSRGRIRVHQSDTSKFAESDAPGVPVHLHIATWAPDRTEVPLPPSQRAITAGVEHLARAGYNALRIHGLEYWLMDLTTGAFNFPADRVALFDWLLAELKRVGIYYIINPRAPELYQDGAGGGRFSMPGGAVNWKPRLFVQQNARDHWLQGFQTLYNRMNPYTGLNILTDPAVLLVECMNECSAQFASSLAWPDVWYTRESPQGSAMPVWRDWLATQYADIAALNTAWSSAHASFAAVPAPTATSSALISATQSSIDAIRYCDALNRNLTAWFKARLTEMGYAGLVSSLIDFPTTLTLKSSGDGAVDVVNLHGYPMLAHYPSDTQLSAPDSPVWGAGTNPGYTSWLLTGGAYADGKPAYLGEFGWPSWASWRNQYPLLTAYAALNGVGSVSHFHQGDFFSRDYSGRAKNRLKALYSYSSHGDPVAMFAEVASGAALRYVREASYRVTIPISDRYSGINLTGTSPRTAGRVVRAVNNLYLPVQAMPSVTGLRLQYSADNTNDDLAATWNARTWFDVLEVLRLAGAIDNANESWISANANRGTITAVATSGSVVGDITVTATATQPVLTIGAHTLVDDDHVAVTNLTGSGGTWPGTNNRGTRAYVKRVSGTQVQIMSGLNLTGLTGFSSGTWCEFDNVAASADGQLYMSRRFKAGHINTPEFKAFFGAGTSWPWSKLPGLLITSLTSGAAIFALALDDLPLASSRRVLIGMVGNTDNTGQTFSDATRMTCTNFGTYPIKQTDCTADIKLTVSEPMDWSLYRLRMDGSRAARESIVASDAVAGTVQLALRSGSVAPAIFWELAR